MASFEAPMLHHQPFDDGSTVTAEQEAKNQIEFNSAKVKYISPYKMRICVYFYLMFCLWLCFRSNCLVKNASWTTQRQWCI